MRLFFKYLILFAVPIILGATVVLLMPLDKQFVYSEFLQGDCDGRGKWVYDRLFVNSAPIDVAFIGSSATWNAVDDRALTDSLTTFVGKPITVANLGYCRPGITLRTVFVEELIAAKKPRVIVLEVLPEPSMGSQPVFGFMASTEQLLRPPTYAYQDWPSDVWKGLVVRWEQVRHGLYEDTTIYVANKKLFGFGDNPAIADQATMFQLHERRKHTQVQDGVSLQDRMSFHLYWETLKDIQKTCLLNGVQLAFYFVNIYGRPSEEPLFLEQHERIAPVWVLPDSTFQNPKNYFDPGHLNNVGAAELTPELFKYLYRFEY
jgi:hypothetical protein